MEEFYSTTQADPLIFVCKNGEFLHTNRKMLSNKTHVFKEEENNAYCIVNFNKSTFREFLNVLMEFQDMTQQKALEIFPVAHKYNMLQLLNACVSVLKPMEINETTIVTLNLAAEYTCDDLINSCLSCISNYGIEKLFTVERLYGLLEPKSVLMLLRNSEMSFILLQGIKLWGNSYLRKNNIDDSLFSFLKKHYISSVLSLKKISSTELVLSLCDKDTKKNLFPSFAFLIHLQSISSCIPNVNWEQMTSQIIGEHFTTHFPTYINTSILFEILLNPIIIDDDTTLGKNLDKYLIPDLTIHGFIISQAAFGQKSICSETSIFSNFSFSPKLSMHFIFKPIGSFYIESVTLHYRFMNEKCKILKMNFQKSQGIFNKCDPGPHFTQDIIITKGKDMLKHK